MAETANSNKQGESKINIWELYFFIIITANNRCLWIERIAISNKSQEKDRKRVKVSKPSLDFSLVIMDRNLKGCSTRDSTLTLYKT